MLDYAVLSVMFGVRLIGTWRHHLLGTSRYMKTADKTPDNN